GIDCLPNKEIFAELSRMGYEKPSTKLTFYKAFFSSQWKFLIHTILQCMSAKRTSWNEFSSSMASAVIYLSTGAAKVNVDDVPADGVANEGVASFDNDVVPAAIDKPSIPSPTPPTQPPPPSQDIPSTSQKLEKRNKLKVLKLRRLEKVGTSQRVETSDDTVMDDVSKQGRIIANMDADVDVTLKDIAKDVVVDAEIEESAVRKGKEDNTVKRYQELKRKLQTEAQARKNMMIYLRNMAGFKMDYFKRMKYDHIHPIFEKYFNSNVAFLEKTKEQMEEEDSRSLKRISETQEEKTAKKQKLDEEVAELKRHLQIVLNDDDDVYTEATPLAARFRVALGIGQRKMILLVERRYPLSRFTLDQMLNNVRLEVEEESKVSLELLRFIRQQQQEGFRHSDVWIHPPRSRQRSS
nr:hypothetical protein [Tanacetum cinerariifolium]